MDAGQKEYKYATLNIYWLKLPTKINLNKVRSSVVKRRHHPLHVCSPSLATTQVLLDGKASWGRTGGNRSASVPQH